MDFVDARAERRSAAVRSALLFSSPTAKQPTFTVRKLRSNELTILSTKNRVLPNTQIFLAIPNDPQLSQVQTLNLLTTQIVDNTFSEFVILPISPPSPSPPPSISPPHPPPMLPMGVHNNNFIANCVFEPYSTCWSNKNVSNTHLTSNSTLSNCGIVCRDATSPNDFGNVLAIDVGPETGGRTIRLSPEETIVSLMEVLLNPHNIKTNPQPQPHSSSCNILSPHSRIDNTQKLCNIFLYNHAVVENSSIVKNAILFPGSRIEDNSVVYSTFLQWNASISNSDVRNALLMECSHAGPNSNVKDSVIGSDSHVSNGEVVNSLLGSSLNSHHQSLLISLIWPLGRGNVGYGANVGSNHTGRSADQEAWVGEGVFFGLSCVVKFPLDLTFSQYSIIAAGVDLLPQKIMFPFSLVAPHADYVEEATGLPPQLDQLHPAWLLKVSEPRA